VRHCAGIVPDRKSEECLGARFLVSVLGPGKKGGADVGAVGIGERSEPERGPVPDLGILVARKPDQRRPRFGRKRLGADRGHGERDGQSYLGVRVGRMPEDQPERSGIADVTQRGDDRSQRSG
jgi:hypothetical protein